MIVRKFNGNKPKVLLFQGSSRDKDTCPNMNSKSHSIVDYMLDKYSPFIEFEVIDLAINQSKKPTIQLVKDVYLHQVDIIVIFLVLVILKVMKKNQI